MNGVGSTHKNGFRYALRNKLIGEGNPVNMIGSQSAGNMADGQCECYPGEIITEVAEKLKGVWGQKPNLVLIHVGTNDCSSNNDVGNAHNRLGKLIDELFNSIEGVTIIAQHKSQHSEQCQHLQRKHLSHDQNTATSRQESPLCGLFFFLVQRRGRQIRRVSTIFRILY